MSISPLTNVKHLLTKAKKLRNNQTTAENILWFHIRAKRLHGYKFRRQVIIGSYIVDFICKKFKLIIELDGGQHNTNTAKKYDVIRSNYLQSKGYKIIRFWNDEVLSNIQAVLEQILRNI